MLLSPSWSPLAIVCVEFALPPILASMFRIISVSEFIFVSTLSSRFCTCATHTHTHVHTTQYTQAKGQCDLIQRRNTARGVAAQACLLDSHSSSHSPVSRSTPRASDDVQPSRTGACFKQGLARIKHTKRFEFGEVLHFFAVHGDHPCVEGGLETARVDTCNAKHRMRYAA